jgi:hypothetical protein
MGQVIRIDAIPRSSLPSSTQEAELRGFTRALKALEALKCCSMRETVIAIQNWAAAGMVSEAEADAIFSYHGWRRGQ